MKTKIAYCAALQKDTEHEVTLDPSGDLVFTCLESGRFFKISGKLSAEEIKAELDARKSLNEGQVSVEEIEAKLDDVLSKI